MEKLCKWESEGFDVVHSKNLKEARESFEKGNFN